MLLAGDIGGTKTLVGLFSASARRPQEIVVRKYRTADFGDLPSLVATFLDDTGRPSIERAAFGVAGPIVDNRATLTNVPWTVSADDIRPLIGAGRIDLLNDLEALAWSISVLDEEEMAVLHEGRHDPRGNAALVAAGTGLGVALLPNVAKRLVPRASEGGHVDFAPRTAREIELMLALAAEFGRVDVEHVVSGPGIANIHRLLFPHRCRALDGAASPNDIPRAVSDGALTHGCEPCRQTLELFVSAYGAAAGNVALTALATGGVYLGGGIAPKILPALRWPHFLDAFLAKAPMDELMARTPVRVIINSRAGLLGAATCAQTLL